MTTDPKDREGFDPYAAPAARVADMPGAGAPVFFPVGLVKLTLMGIACLGLYQVYWFYRNWRDAAHARETAFGAALRALFYPLTAYFLFRRMEVERARHGAGQTIAAGPLAVALFVLSLSWRLPDPYWLVAILAFAPMLPVQGAVNALNAKVAPEADQNRRLSGWNIGALVLGGIVLLLAIVGVLAGADA